ncbi:hypothetical protein [Shinella sp. NM-101]|uniref:hypothetical protein n=1 Tax=Shinella sp. NM-101 TaxID=2744455 RepID=UPI001F20FF27|nr:hypothetical protein [Shinella sp. NM-101]
MIAYFELKRTVLTLALAALLSTPATASEQDEDALTAAALGLVEARVSELGLRDPAINLVFGDLTGTGTADAIAFVSHTSGGSSEMLTTWILRQTGGTYAIGREVSNEELFGFDPRNLQFSPGCLSVTMTVPQANDPHCCPTGTRTFTIEVE